jgi:hypothetical protein
MTKQTGLDGPHRDKNDEISGNRLKRFYRLCVVASLVVPSIASASASRFVFSLAPSLWAFQNKGAVLFAADGGLAFDFPFPNGRVNYLITPAPKNITVGKKLSATFVITTTSNPIFSYRTNPNNTCGSGSPGTVRLFIQRAGDNLSAVGEFQQYRYWSNQIFVNLVPGTSTISVPITPDQWSDVYGKTGVDFPDAFADTLKNAGSIGMTFGGGCFYGHGVNVSGGTARFTLTDFSLL